MGLLEQQLKAGAAHGTPPTGRVRRRLNRRLAVVVVLLVLALQLGNPTNDKTGEPSPTLTLPGASGPITQVAAGYAHSLALTSRGRLYAFGENYFGQLGSATNSKTGEPNPTPTLVRLPGVDGPVTQIAASAEHSLALTSSGQLYAFGENYFGQLGSATNSKTGEPNPTPTPVRMPGGAGPVTQVAAGEDHSLALTSSGRLYAFGENYYGQLGSATNNETLEPNPTPTQVRLPGAAGPVTQIAAGYAYSLALTSSGRLYAFGENRFGQLGNATNDKTEEPNPTPTLVRLPGAAGPVTQIAAGEDHSLALTSSGRLYAFGYNYYGQLGNATNDKTEEPNPTPTPVRLPGAAGPVTQIAAGEDHSLALTSSGRLYAFGDDRYGQLGNATNNRTGEPNPTPTPVRLPGAAGPVTQVAAGAEHSLALTSSGRLYTFGYNYYGQLGNATSNRTEQPNPTPTLVRLPRAPDHANSSVAAADGPRPMSFVRSGSLNLQLQLQQPPAGGSR